MTSPPPGRMTGLSRPDRRPVVLTKLDAFQFAAEQLERMAADCDLVGILLNALRKSGTGAQEVKAQVRELQEAVPEPELQAAALREGAGAIRDMMLEERLVAARATAKGVAP